QRIALPLREQITRIDDQRAWADRRVPPDLGRLKAVAGAMIGDVEAVIIVAVGGDRPAIILARQDEIYLVAAARAHLIFPQPSLGIEHQAIGVAMARAPGLDRRQVRP